MKKPSAAELQRQIMRWRLSKINRGKLWSVDVSKMGLENMSLENLRQLDYLVRTIEFYEDRVDVTYESATEGGETMFHAGKVTLKDKLNESPSKQS